MQIFGKKAEYSAKYRIFGLKTNVRTNTNIWTFFSETNVCLRTKGKFPFRLATACDILHPHPGTHDWSLCVVTLICFEISITDCRKQSHPPRSLCNGSLLLLHERHKYHEYDWPFSSLHGHDYVESDIPDAGTQEITILGGDEEYRTVNGIMGQTNRTVHGPVRTFGPLFHFLCDILCPHPVPRQCKAILIQNYCSSSRWRFWCMFSSSWRYIRYIFMINDPIVSSIIMPIFKTDPHNFHIFQIDS